MKIQIGKRFSKDVQGITDKRILRKIRGVLDRARSAESLGEVQELEAMSGYSLTGHRSPYGKTKEGLSNQCVTIFYGWVIFQREGSKPAFVA